MGNRQQAAEYCASAADLAAEFDQLIGQTAAALETASSKIADRARPLSETTEDLDRQSAQIVGAAAETCGNARLASSGINILSNSIQEIAGSVEEQAALSVKLNGSSASSAEAVRALSSQADEIGGFVSV